MPIRSNRSNKYIYVNSFEVLDAHEIAFSTHLNEIGIWNVHINTITRMDKFPVHIIDFKVSGPTDRLVILSNNKIHVYEDGKINKIFGDNVHHIDVLKDGRILSTSNNIISVWK